MDAYEYWRDACPEISNTEVDEYKAKYIGSDEEKQDFIDAFNACKGNFFEMATCRLFFTKSDTIDRDIDLMRTLLSDDKIQKKYIKNFEKSVETVKNKLLKYERDEEEKFNVCFYTYIRKDKYFITIFSQKLQQQAVGKNQKGSEKADLGSILQLMMQKNKGKGSLLDSTS